MITYKRGDVVLIEFVFSERTGKKKSFRNKVKRIISKKKFDIQSPQDLEEAFRFADTEEGGAMTQPGRVLVYFP